MHHSINRDSALRHAPQVLHGREFKTKRWLLIASLVVGVTTTLPARDVVKLYAENCARCHGANLEGGQTDSLLDDQWKHGGDDASVARVIRDGAELNGMPPWKGFLSDAEVRAMVVLIREKAAQAVGRTASYARPMPGEAARSEEHAFRLELVADRLSTPWSIAFMPDGRLLITELPGALRFIDQDGAVSAPVAGTPAVRAEGQGGMMDAELHPDYARNGWIYLAYSDRVDLPGQPNLGMTKVVRGRIKEERWIEQETLFQAPAERYRPGGVHFGSRLVFDSQGHLFFSIGERGTMEHAQDLSRPNGKVHRVHADGRIPADNPFVGISNAVPSIWSYGHRNPQGLARHPQTGDLWDTEHGPRGGDELNLVLKGRNYGWPAITYGMNYNGFPISALTAQAGMEQPVIHWTPSIAVCSANFYVGTRFPKWQNNLLVTALARENCAGWRSQTGPS